MSDIDKKGVYCGTPVIEAKQYMKNIAVFNRLYDIKNQLISYWRTSYEY